MFLTTFYRNLRFQHTKKLKVNCRKTQFSAERPRFPLLTKSKHKAVLIYDPEKQGVQKAMRVGYLGRFLSYDQVTVSGDYDVGICSIYCTHCQMHHCAINLKVRQHVYFFQMLRFMFGEKFNLAKYPGLRFRDSLIKIAPLLQPNENFPC